MYGRIIRDGSGAVLKIVEAKDASPQEKQSTKHAGIYVFDGEHLFDNLRNLRTQMRRASTTHGSARCSA